MLKIIGRDFEYFQRARLRHIYERVTVEVAPYAAAKGQPWTISGNVYNGLGWDNAVCGATALTVPFGELSVRQHLWPDRNYASFFKNLAALELPDATRPRT